MVERSSVLATVLALAVLASMGVGVIAFLQTRDPAMIVGYVVAVPVVLVTLAVLGWVHGDAPTAGLPRWPWMAAVALAPGVGLVGYLLARELADPAGGAQDPA